MRRATAAVGVVVFVMTAIPFIKSAQAQRLPSRWQHAYVVFAPWQGTAEIVYIEETGCRRQIVTVDPIMSDVDPRFIDAQVTQGRAVAQAVLILGNNAWEMIGAGSPYCSGADGRALLFKRAR